MSISRVFSLFFILDHTTLLGAYPEHFKYMNGKKLVPLTGWAYTRIMKFEWDEQKNQAYEDEFGTPCRNDRRHD